MKVLAFCIVIMLLLTVPVFADEAEIWEQIYAETESEIATAAIMGNLMYESALCPYRFEGLTKDESKKLIDIYRDNESKFVYSLRAYGLAGWTYSSNLQRLWDYCEDNDYAVDDEQGQIEFLLEDYKANCPNSYNRLIHYDNLVTATEDFRQSYEKSTGDYVSQYRRAKHAKDIYERYTGKTDTSEYNFEISEDVKKMNGILN